MMRRRGRPAAAVDWRWCGCGEDDERRHGPPGSGGDERRREPQQWRRRPTGSESWREQRLQRDNSSNEALMAKALVWRNKILKLRLH
ncbi:hypothetical protein Scep_016979 [Stephania cephalantha]|uniref:Uncharacterized protein n=1 Tax=Stephania cephalantha TaxID=152367 RepID=A0AAP0NWG5_9MAGN